MGRPGIRGIWVGGIAVALVMVQAACGSTSSATKQLSIAMIAGVSDTEFYTASECGADAAAKALNVKLSYNAPSTFSVAAEEPLISAALTTKPDGMLMVPDDPNALIATVQSIVKQGIPVVTFDGNLSKAVDYQNIRTSNGGGSEAAKYLGAAMNGTGTALIVANLPSVTANEVRVTTFTNYMTANYPNIKILPVEYPGSDVTTAATETAAALLANPDLSAIYTTQVQSADGAIEALTAAGKIGKVKLVGYDAAPAEVAALAAGQMTALIVQKPYDEGYMGITTLVNVLRGKVKRSALTYQVFLDPVVATQANMNDLSISKWFYPASLADCPS